MIPENKVTEIFVMADDFCMGKRTECGNQRH